MNREPITLADIERMTGGKADYDAERNSVRVTWPDGVSNAVSRLRSSKEELFRIAAFSLADWNERRKADA
jgi:hypothetical protein